MNNPVPFRSRVSALLLLLAIPGIFPALSAGRSEAADFSGYCQYPPYVFQSKLPSVMLLVSNSYSMSGFAYMNNASDTEANASDGFVPGHRYYGYFDPDYWYDSNWNKTGTKTTSPKPGTTYWHGSFLNWLTMRRIDVVNKLLTGGMDVGQKSTGYESCGNDNTLFKKYVDDGYYAGTDRSGRTVFAEFTHKATCTGKSLSGLELYYYQGTNKTSLGIKNVIGDPPTGNGLIQRNLPKAQIGLAFYNEKGDGANIAVPTKSNWGSADYNDLKTPSQYNNEADQPLADALFTIAGYFAQVPNTDNLVNTSTLGSCTSSSPCGPIYGNGYSISNSVDPFYQHGALSQCTKGNVIILTDGEPCSDGNLPSELAHFADSTLFHCDATTCFAAGGFAASPGPPACISRSGVGQTGREKASLEDVALWAHTTDLRSSIPNTNGFQNLDIWIVRAFGFSTSNLLKYAAINGSFDVSTGTQPATGNYRLDDAYFESDDPYAIENALNNIFQQLLRRATSGTAASVLASGEGSGANLVQAVFYPRRRFFDEVIDWTGTLQNLWYYVDPFFTGASIREDSNKSSAADYTPVLNLVTDNTIVYYFDQASQTTKANRYVNDSTGNATTTFDVIPFEEVKSIWEAGEFLHARSPSTRTIFTAIDNAVPRTKLPFEAGNASTLKGYLGAASDGEATAIIQYVRGVDDVDGDGAIDFRQRTVPHPTSTDNAVWKLGDVINSTPKIASRVSLNTYEKTYLDKTYKDFINSDTYRNRGMVFVGGNDGMLHAFKLGKLEFPGDNNWTSAGAKDRARLRNLEYSADPSTAPPLGSERWGFIPKNAMPYLRALLDNNYCHLYYVDLSPQLFDASIGGADNAVRTKDSWRTILIGGMRFGGACRDNTASCTDCVKSPVSGNGLSSYFAIDVTDPESPTVLWEFSDSALGFATTGPAVVRINEHNNAGNADRTLNGKWFVVFGSGPTGPISGRQFLGRSDQTLKLFVVDLKTGALLRTIDRYGSGAGTTIANAFAGSMANSTADFNLDYQDDAVYLGYVKAESGVWNQGGVVRLQTKGDRNPANWVASKVIDDVGPVTSSVVRLQNNTFHTNWLFFGTGRYFFASESARDDGTVPRNLFGLKEPCFTDQNVINPGCTTPVSAGDLQTVTDATALDETTTNSLGFPGWKIDLDTATLVDYDGTGERNFQPERVITDPLATVAGTVFFTTFRPYGENCSIGGRTFLWGVRYNTGLAPAYALQGRALMQVSTASIEQLDLKDAFTKSVTGAVDTLHRGGRRSYALEGVPPTAQGLSILSQPPALKRILHMKER